MKGSELLVYSITHVLLSIMPSLSVPGLPGPRGCLSALAWTKPIAFPTVYSDSCTATKNKAKIRARKWVRI